MLYTLKGIILAGYAVQLAQASECTDKWSTVRCARQEKKGNCVPEAECPNPKKGGVKCKRANANCQATCGQCSSDDCAILVANLTSELEICTASLPVAAAGCPLQALTVEEGEQWCADTCPLLDMHVVSSNNQDYTNQDYTMPAGICVVVDATAGDVVSTTLTYDDDCLVVAGDNRVSDVNGRGGNDLMCGGPGNDDNFRGDDGNDTLNGGPGADNYFYGGYGDDTFYGGPGDDFRFGGGSGEGGDDKLYGGDGDDKYFSAGAGDDTLHGGAGDDENFYGDAGDDTLYGGDGDDYYFIGGDGDDMLYGGDGDDKLFKGGDGDDKLYGGDGDDTYFLGEDGDDRLYGEDGDDQYFYGGGGDNLVNP